MSQENLDSNQAAQPIEDQVEDLLRQYLTAALKFATEAGVILPSDFFSKLDLQVYTPGSDLAAGLKQNQIIWSRNGKDTLIGYQRLRAEAGQVNIDILVGETAIIPDPSVRSFGNRFVLGDWRKAYYTNGRSQNSGLNDYAYIVDFNSTRDTIQLHGSSKNYRLVKVAGGVEIVYKKPNGVSDVIAFVEGNSNLNLRGKYFRYEGSSPPQVAKSQIKQVGSPGFDLTPSITTDSAGNVYLVGGTTGSLGTTNNADVRQSFLAKYDSNGNQLFVKQENASAFNTISSIETDAQGNFYTIGITGGRIATPLQAARTDAVLAKYDSSGREIWVRQFGKNAIYQGNSISVDSSGNSYVTGVDVTPFPQEGIIALSDATWVAKYNTNGTRQWYTQIGSSTNFTESYDNALDGNGDVYATGWTGNLAASVEGQRTRLYDGWISKLDGNTGQIEWFKQFGTQDYEWSWSVATDSQDNVYATGWTLGNLGGTNAGSYDAFLAKYDSQGNKQWIKQFGSYGDDQAFDIYIDSQDRLFLTGYTDGKLGGSVRGSFDAWVTEYDTNGNRQWITKFGTSKLDQAYGITGDKSNNLYVAGTTLGSLGAANAGSADGWVAKLNANNGALENFSGTSSAST